jgi:hypothetical protein
MQEAVILNNRAHQSTIFVTPATTPEQFANLRQTTILASEVFP